MRITNNKLVFSMDENATRLPMSLIIGTLLVCMLPFTLTLLGIDFSTNSTPVNLSWASQYQLSDTQFHALSGAFTYTLLEWTALCVAAFVVILAFSHYRISHDVTTPIIGVALFIAGCIDIFPILVTDPLTLTVADNSELVPLTSAVSRLLSALIMISCVGILLLCNQNEKKKAGIVCVVGISLIFGMFTYLIINNPVTNIQLPQVTYPESILSRPYDAFPLILFAFAGLVVYPRMYKRHPSLFTHALIISAIPAVATQLHMTFGSTALYDSHFNIGHFLKIVAYSIPLIGLSLDNMRTHRLLQREVTERKKAEEALIEIETHQGTILQTVADAIITIDKQSIIQTFNPAAEKIFGYHHSEAIGNNVSMLLPKMQQQKHERYTLNSRLYAPRIINKNRDLQGQRKDGSLFPIEINITPMKLGGNEGFVGILRDITQRKKNEQLLEKTTQEAKAANHAKSEFLAAMTHEIRTPMNAVLGVLGLLRDTQLNSNQRTLVHTGRESGELLLSIINDILDFSKMEADKLQLENTSFDLHLLFTHSVELLKLQADHKDLALILTLQPNVPRYGKGDPDRLLQVLINLINNAIKFTPDGSISVRVSADKFIDQAFTLHCEVQDSGIGIAKQHQATLFDEFTMADQSHTRHYEGTGLGLAICKRLVTLMHGNIGVTSEIRNGSTFFFDVQLQPTTEQSCNYKPAIDEPLRQPAVNTRVLLAEDNPANQMVIKKILEHAYLQVDIAANGQEAIKAITNLPYDIVLMDISMPVMDGMTATREIRNLGGQAAKLPIIALTAHALKGDRERFMQAGMNDYLSKPIDRAATLHCIARWTGASATTKHPATDQSTIQTSTIADDSEDSYIQEQILQQLMNDTSPDIMLMLLVLYIKDAEYRTQHIQQALVEKNIKVLEAETHTLSSSAAAYGNQKLHKLAQHIEHLFQQGSHQQALILAATLPKVANKSFVLLMKWSDKEFESFKTGEQGAKQ